MNEEYDMDFYEIVYDEDGNKQYRLKETITTKMKPEGLSVYFDDSHGHCAFCGSISCNGKCFK